MGFTDSAKNLGKNLVNNLAVILVSTILLLISAVSFNKLPVDCESKLLRDGLAGIMASSAGLLGIGLAACNEDSVVYEYKIGLLSIISLIIIVLGSVLVIELTKDEYNEICNKEELLPLLMLIPAFGMALLGYTFGFWRGRNYTEKSKKVAQEASEQVVKVEEKEEKSE